MAVDAIAQYLQLNTGKNTQNLMPYHTGICMSDLIHRLKRALRYVTDFILDRNVVESDQESYITGLMEILELKRQMASYAIAQWREKRQKIAKESRCYVLLEQQAEQFLRDGETLLARNCVLLQLDTERRIEEIRAELTTLESDVIEKCRQFNEKKQEVE